MIKTLKQFLSQENDIIIEQITGDWFDFVEVLKEEYSYAFYQKDSKEKLPVDDYFKRKFKETEIKIKDYLDTTNPFLGAYTKKERPINTEFDIVITEHWITKLFRKDFEDKEGKRGIINPGIYEGIDLMRNNRNLITEYVTKGTMKHGDKYLIKTKDNSKYSLIIKLEKENQKYYNIIFITQIKGVDFLGQIGEKIIKMHPKGPL